jgi:hypothetical protein
MRMTEIGRDLIVVTEDDLGPGAFQANTNESKIHLIKFKFKEPSKSKILTIMDKFPTTKRFIVSDNIKSYNEILKTTNCKYYIQNRLNSSGIVSFFRKNNKVFLSIPSLLSEEKDFVLNYALDDVLRNLEIIMIEQKDYEKHIDAFFNWKGNVVLFDKDKYSFIL